MHTFSLTIADVLQKSRDMWCYQSKIIHQDRLLTRCGTIH